MAPDAQLLGIQLEAVVVPGLQFVDAPVSYTHLDVYKRQVLCTKHVIPVMLEQGGGSIIFATSGLGVQGDMSLSGYATSKAALLMLPKLVACLLYTSRCV